MKSTIAQHANFRDPLGLLYRMLRSRDRAARSAIYRTATGVALGPLDHLLAPLERRRLASASTQTRYPLILVVGAPRSGTTLVYQTLARFLPVTYFTNFSALFPRAPLTASRLPVPLFRNRTVDLHSYYGNTAGMAAPNDGFHIWNRWLGTDRYRTPTELSPETEADMQRFFGAWTGAFRLPLVNKNNRNTACVSLLARILPEALFVDVHRDPVYVAQSLLIARARIQGSKSHGWGLASRDYDQRRGPLGYVDDVCDQVVDIEERLARDKQAIGAGRFVEVSYERFCENPAATVRRIYQRLCGEARDAEALPIPLGAIDPTNNVRIEAEEFARIVARLGETQAHAGQTA